MRKIINKKMKNLNIKMKNKKNKRKTEIKTIINIMIKKNKMKMIMNINLNLNITIYQIFKILKFKKKNLQNYYTRNTIFKRIRLLALKKIN